jgi:hypothetical protein
MQSPDMSQMVGGGANIDIKQNEDGSFTGTLPIPGFPPVTAPTEQEVIQQLTQLLQQIMGQGGMQGQMPPAAQGPGPQGGPPMMGGQGPMM